MNNESFHSDFISLSLIRGAACCQLGLCDSLESQGFISEAEIMNNEQLILSVASQVSRRKMFVTLVTFFIDLYW